jgi:hypothetical protein
VDHFDDFTLGLSLRITSNTFAGGRYFSRQERSPERLTLGRHAAVTAADARELAREAQRTMARGGDPAFCRRSLERVDHRQLQVGDVT